MKKTLYKKAITEDIEATHIMLPKSVLWERISGRFPGLQPFCADPEYMVTSSDIVERIAERSTLDKEKEKDGDTFDCDFAAVCFKGETARQFGLNSVGLVADYATGLTYTIILYFEDKKNPHGTLTLSAFDPQTDSWKVIGTPGFNAKYGFIFF